MNILYTIACQKKKKKTVILSIINTIIFREEFSQILVLEILSILKDLIFK